MSAVTLVDRMLAGDRVALARLITLVENRHADTTMILSRIHPHCGCAFTIGVTGPPGAGKSTLVDRLTALLRGAEHCVGIVAIDPSSPFSGGAVLGDRIRMQGHYLDEQVFIRSLSTRGSHGGLARATRNVAQLLDAFGKQFILIETVGVGQTELDVMRVADTVIVVLVPEAGDTVQTMKAGLLEIADIFVVNKADREGAVRIKAELEMMLQLRPPADWTVPVLATEGTTGKGIDELLAAVLRHRDFLVHSGSAAAHTAAVRREEFVAALRDELSRRIEVNVKNECFSALLERVEGGEVDPYGAALDVIGDEDAVRTLARGNTPGGVKS